MNTEKNDSSFSSNSSSPSSPLKYDYSSQISPFFQSQTTPSIFNSPNASKNNSPTLKQINGHCGHPLHKMRKKQNFANETHHQLRQTAIKFVIYGNREEAIATYEKSIMAHTECFTCIQELLQLFSNDINKLNQLNYLINLAKEKFKSCECLLVVKYFIFKKLKKYTECLSVLDALIEIDSLNIKYLINKYKILKLTKLTEENLRLIISLLNEILLIYYKKSSTHPNKYIIKILKYLIIEYKNLNDEKKINELLKIQEDYKDNLLDSLKKYLGLKIEKNVDELNPKPDDPKQNPIPDGLKPIHDSDDPKLISKPEGPKKPNAKPDGPKPIPDSNDPKLISKPDGPIKPNPIPDGLKPISDSDGPKPNPQSDGPKPNSVLDDPKPNPKPDGPKTNPQSDGPKPNSVLDDPKPNPKPDGSKPNPQSDGPKPNSVLDDPNPKPDGPKPNSVFEDPKPNPKPDGPKPNSKPDGPKPNPQFDGPKKPNEKPDGPKPNPKPDGPKPNPQSDGPKPNSVLDDPKPKPNPKPDGPKPNSVFDDPKPNAKPDGPKPNAKPDDLKPNPKPDGPKPNAKPDCPKPNSKPDCPKPNAKPDSPKPNAKPDGPKPDDPKPNIIPDNGESQYNKLFIEIIEIREIIIKFQTANQWYEDLLELLKKKLDKKDFELFGLNLPNESKNLIKIPDPQNHGLKIEKLNKEIIELREMIIKFQTAIQITINQVDVNKSTNITELLKKKLDKTDFEKFIMNFKESKNEVNKADFEKFILNFKELKNEIYKSLIEIENKIKNIEQNQFNKNKLELHIIDWQNFKNTYESWKIQIDNSIQNKIINVNIESNKQLDIAEFNNFIAIFEKLKEKPNINVNIESNNTINKKLDIAEFNKFIANFEEWKEKLNSKKNINVTIESNNIINKKLDIAEFNKFIANFEEWKEKLNNTFEQEYIKKNNLEYYINYYQKTTNVSTTNIQIKKSQYTNPNEKNKKTVLNEQQNTIDKKLDIKIFEEFIKNFDEWKKELDNRKYIKKNELEIHLVEWRNFKALYELRKTEIDNLHNSLKEEIIKLKNEKKSEKTIITEDFEKTKKNEKLKKLDKDINNIKLELNSKYIEINETKLIIEDRIREDEDFEKPKFKTYNENSPTTQKNNDLNETLKNKIDINEFNQLKIELYEEISKKMDKSIFSDLIDPKIKSINDRIENYLIMIDKKNLIPDEIKIIINNYIEKNIYPYTNKILKDLPIDIQNKLSNQINTKIKILFEEEYDLKIKELLGNELNNIDVKKILLEKINEEYKNKVKTKITKVLENELNNIDLNLILQEKINEEFKNKFKNKIAILFEKELTNIDLNKIVLEKINEEYKKNAKNMITKLIETELDNIDLNKILLEKLNEEYKNNANIMIKIFIEKELNNTDFKKILFDKINEECKKNVKRIMAENVLNNLNNALFMLENYNYKLGYNELDNIYEKYGNILGERIKFMVLLCSLFSANKLGKFNEEKEKEILKLDPDNKIIYQKYNLENKYKLIKKNIKELIKINKKIRLIKEKIKILQEKKSKEPTKNKNINETHNKNKVKNLQEDSQKLNEFDENEILFEEENNNWLQIKENLKKKKFEIKRIINELLNSFLNYKKSNDINHVLQMYFRINISELIQNDLNILKYLKKEEKTDKNNEQNKFPKSNEIIISEKKINKLNEELKIKTKNSFEVIIKIIENENERNMLESNRIDQEENKFSQEIFIQPNNNTKKNHKLLKQKKDSLDIVDNKPDLSTIQSNNFSVDFNDLFIYFNIIKSDREEIIIFSNNLFKLKKYFQKKIDLNEKPSEIFNYKINLELISNLIIKALFTIELINLQNKKKLDIITNIFSENISELNSENALFILEKEINELINYYKSSWFKSQEINKQYNLIKLSICLKKNDIKSLKMIKSDDCCLANLMKSILYHINGKTKKRDESFIKSVLIDSKYWLVFFCKGLFSANSEITKNYLQKAKEKYLRKAISIDQKQRFEKIISFKNDIKNIDQENIFIILIEEVQNVLNNTFKTTLKINNQQKINMSIEKMNNQINQYSNNNDDDKYNQLYQSIEELKEKFKELEGKFTNVFDLLGFKSKIEFKKKIIEIKTNPKLFKYYSVFVSVLINLHRNFKNYKDNFIQIKKNSTPILDIWNFLSSMVPFVGKSIINISQFGFKNIFQHFQERKYDKQYKLFMRFEDKHDSKVFKKLIKENWGIQLVSNYKMQEIINNIDDKNINNNKWGVKTDRSFNGIWDEMKEKLWTKSFDDSLIKKDNLSGVESFAFSDIQAFARDYLMDITYQGFGTNPEIDYDYEQKIKINNVINFFTKEINRFNIVKKENQSYWRKYLCSCFNCFLCFTKNRENTQ